MSRPYVESHCGGFIIGRAIDPETGERGRLVQTDWDFPEEANALGWNMRRVQRTPALYFVHIGTGRNGLDLWRKFATEESARQFCGEVFDRSGVVLAIVKSGGSTRVLKRRAPKRGTGCDHSSTDGTVNCANCGVTASEFIAAAGEYLDSLC